MYGHGYHYSGTVPGRRKPGRQQLRWEDNITDWTKLTIAETHQLTKDSARDREAWRTLVREINGAPTTNTGKGKNIYFVCGSHLCSERLVAAALRRLAWL